MQLLGNTSSLKNMEELRIKVQLHCKQISLKLSLRAFRSDMISEQWSLRAQLGRIQKNSLKNEVSAEDNKNEVMWRVL